MIYAASAGFNHPLLDAYPRLFVLCKNFILFLSSFSDEWDARSAN